jgi:hypothetical protein
MPNPKCPFCEMETLIASHAFLRANIGWATLVYCCNCGAVVAALPPTADHPERPSGNNDLPRVVAQNGDLSRRRKKIKDKEAELKTGNFPTAADEVDIPPNERGGPSGSNTGAT